MMISALNICISTTIIVYRAGSKRWQVKQNQAWKNVLVEIVTSLMTAEDNRFMLETKEAVGWIPFCQKTYDGIRSAAGVEKVVGSKL